MPYLRFSRDRRGYENTFVVHQERRRGRPRSRVLYWFRTPPGVKVGRAALDEDAIRLIEELNPDIEFDWTRMLKGDADAVPAPRAQSPRRAHDARGPGPRRRRPGEAAPPRPPAPFSPAGESAVPEEGSEYPEEAIESPPPSTDFSASAIGDMEGEVEGPPVTEPGGDVALSLAPTPAQLRLGPEGVVRLRARYAELSARITERIHDPERRDQLKGQADRLNPDNWVTEAEVQAGLDEYEAVFESLRAVVGKRRRRRRRGARGGPRGAAESPQPADAAGAENDTPDTEDEDTDVAGEPDDR